MEKAKIFIVEDDYDEAGDIKGMIHDMGYMVVGLAGNQIDAIKGIKTMLPDLVLLDIELIKKTKRGNKNDPLGGIEVAKFIKEQLPSIPFIFFSSLKDSRLNKMNTLGAGVFSFIPKPVDEKLLSKFISYKLGIIDEYIWKGDDEEKVEKYIRYTPSKSSIWIKKNKEDAGLKPFPLKRVIKITTVKEKARVIIHLTSEKENDQSIEEIEIPFSLKDIANYLCGKNNQLFVEYGSVFARVDRSIIINLGHVIECKFESHYIWLTNEENLGQAIKIQSAYFEKVDDFFSRMP